MYDLKVAALYKRKRNSKEFICKVTKKKCERVTQYSIEINRVLQQKGLGASYTLVRNLCKETNCPIWENFMKENNKQR